MGLRDIERTTGKTLLSKFLTARITLTCIQAVKESLNIVNVAIVKHPKSATVKHVSSLVKILYRAFDVRCEQLANDRTAFSGEDIESIEAQVNEVTIKMIYKLNDTIFRPIFIQLTDWATSKTSDKDAVTGVRRLTTFYKFLGSFFGTLKVRRPSSKMEKLDV